MSSKFKSFEDLRAHLVETGEITAPVEKSRSIGEDTSSGVKKNKAKGKKTRNSKNKSPKHTHKQSKNMKKAIESAVRSGNVNPVFKHSVEPLPLEHNNKHSNDEEYWKLDAVLKDKRKDNSIMHMAPPKDSNSLSEIRHVDLLSIGGPHKCIKQNHRMEDLRATVNVITKVGTEKSISFNATYCFECNKYFMEDWQYDLLSERGIPMCKVSFEEHSKHGEVNSVYGKLNAESLIHQYGYNVQEKLGLTDIQRQTLLMYLLENGIVKSKMEITTHLTWLINQKIGNPVMANAVAKWKADREFVEKYKLGTYKVVVVRSIKKLHG